MLCRDNAHEVTEDVEGCGETLLFPKAFLNWQIIRMNLLFRKKLEVMMCYFVLRAAVMQMFCVLQ